MSKPYARVEKVINGYVIQQGGPGSGQLKQWVAADLADVLILLEAILEEKPAGKAPKKEAPWVPPPG